MTKGLDAGQVTLLESAVFLSETLVEIEAASNYYYTTGGIDIVATTDTSGGSQTFLSRSLIDEISPIPELTLSVNQKLGIVFTGTDLSIPQTFVNGTTVRLYKVFRDTSTYAIKSSDPILAFEGQIIKRTLRGSRFNQTLQFDLISVQGLAGRYSSVKNNKGITEV